jgi:hypothetical protein
MLSPMTSKSFTTVVALLLLFVVRPASAAESQPPELKAIALPGTNLSDASFSPDSRLVSYGRSDMYLYDIAKGERVGYIPKAGVYQAVFSRDGKYVARGAAAR